MPARTCSAILADVNNPSDANQKIRWKALHNRKQGRHNVVPKEYLNEQWDIAEKLNPSSGKTSEDLLDEMILGQRPQGTNYHTHDEG